MPPFLFDVVDGTVESIESKTTPYHTRPQTNPQSSQDFDSKSKRYFAEDTLMILATLGCQVLLWILDPTLWMVGVFGIIVSTILIMGYTRLDISCTIGTMFVAMFFITILAYIVLPFKFAFCMIRMYL